jgi:hypothetical protein
VATLVKVAGTDHIAASGIHDLSSGGHSSLDGIFSGGRDPREFHSTQDVGFTTLASTSRPRRFFADRLAAFSFVAYHPLGREHFRILNHRIWSTGHGEPLSKTLEFLVFSNQLRARKSPNPL